MARRRTGSNGLVRGLSFFFLFVGIRRLWKIRIAVLALDVLAHFGQGFVRHTRRISTHVRDKTDQAFLAQLHTFIQTLGDHHGALYAETQFARGILLQLAGSKRGSRITAALLAINGTNQPIGFLQSGADLLSFLAVVNFDLVFAFADKAGIERGRLGAGELSVDGSVFLLLERLDLALTLHNEAQRNRLHAAGRKTAAHFIP